MKHHYLELRLRRLQKLTGFAVAEKQAYKIKQGYYLISLVKQEIAKVSNHKHLYPEMLEKIDINKLKQAAA